MFNTLVFANATAHQTLANTSISNMPQIFLLIGLGLIIYALMWRPQAKREQERQTLLSLLAKGDVIYTTGGVVGRITQLYDSFIRIEIDKGVQIYIQKGAVVDTVPKGSLKNILDFA